MKNILSALLIGFIVAVISSNARAEEPVPECSTDPVLDVVFAVDTTHHMRPYLYIFRNLLPALMVKFQKKYPNSSYGFLSFNENWRKCGQDGAPDDCVRVDIPISDNPNSVMDSLHALTAHESKLSPSQTALEAVLVSCEDQQIGWRPLDPNVNRIRVLVVVTDVAYLNTNSSDIEKVKAAVHRMKVLPLFLTAPEQVEVFNILLKKLDVPGMTRGFDDKSAEVLDAVQEAAKSFVCPSGPYPDTTSTSTPTSTPTSTSGPTTSPPPAEETTAKGLSPGAMAAVIAASAVGVAGIAGGVYYAFRSSSANAAEETDGQDVDMVVPESDVPEIPREQFVDMEIS